jgi:hypothetical protein
MKKRGTALLLALTLGICMAGCGAQSEETDDSSQTAQTQDDTDTGNSQEEEQGSAGGQGNVLVAYFSWQTMPFSKTMWMPCLRQA